MAIYSQSSTVIASGQIHRNMIRLLPSL